MDFLTLDKIFVLDNFNIVVDKIYFVQADGRGIRYLPACGRQITKCYKNWCNLTGHSMANRNLMKLKGTAKLKSQHHFMTLRES